MKWERKDSDSVTLGSNVTMEYWADLSSPNPIAWLPVLGPHAGKKSSTWAKAIRTAPMLNQPVKGVWPICQVDVQIGKEGNAAPVGLYMHPQINSEQGGSSQWRGAAHMAAGCSGDSVPSGRR